MKLSVKSVFGGYALCRAGSISLVLVSGVLFPQDARASFQDTPLSIKAEGLGGAFVGMADDASTLFVNSAGLSTLNSPEATMMYGKPMYGLEGLNLNQGYAAIGIPIGRSFALGLGGTMFQAAGLLSEYQGMAGLAARITPHLAAGLNLTYLYHSYDIGKDPAYSSSFANGTAKGAVGADIGLLALVNSRLQFGFSVRNANSPDVGLNQEDRVPRDMRIGGMYRFRYARFLFDYENRQDAPVGMGANTLHAGVEVPIKQLSLRAGANNNGVTAGMGLAMGHFRLDYAFSMLSQVQASNDGNQSLALSVQLGNNVPRGGDERSFNPELNGDEFNYLQLDDNKALFGN